jgi:hypothetical protein
LGPFFFSLPVLSAAAEAGLGFTFVLSDFAGFVWAAATPVIQSAASIKTHLVSSFFVMPENFRLQIKQHFGAFVPKSRNSSINNIYIGEIGRFVQPNPPVSVNYVR